MSSSLLADRYLVCDSVLQISISICSGLLHGGLLRLTVSVGFQMKSIYKVILYWVLSRRFAFKHNKYNEYVLLSNLVYYPSNLSLTHILEFFCQSCQRHVNVRRMSFCLYALVSRFLYLSCIHITFSAEIWLLLHFFGAVCSSVTWLRSIRFIT